MKPVRVLIVDRNPEVRRALAARLNSSRRIAVLATATDAQEAIPLIAAQTPQVVVLDSKSLGQPPDAGQIGESVRALRRLGSRIVVLATYSDESERQAFALAGVNRYLLKDIDSAALIAAIAEIAAEPALTGQRE